MNLENKEIESLAHLKEDFGFNILLDRIQAELDNMQTDILNEPFNMEKLSLWKALYKIFYILKTVPDDMHKEMLKLRQETTYEQVENQLEAMNPDYLQSLMKIYEDKKKKANKL